MTMFFKKLSRSNQITAFLYLFFMIFFQDLDNIKQTQYSFFAL